MKRRPLLLALLLLVATTALADWQKVGPGVDYQRFTTATTDIHVTRIDLTNDEIRVVATRESERGLRVSELAKKIHALAAINGDYFDPKMNPVGLTVGPCGAWQGSKDTAREGVVAVGAKQARIDRQKDVMDPVEDWVETAISGWPVLVVDCEPLTAAQLPGSDPFTRAPHPRTAVGLSRDRKTLYFVVADGRRQNAPGLTLAELGKFMAEELEACSAINLDGGGSTAMWVSDRIVNKPSDGTERRVADHLAVVLRKEYDERCDVEKAQLAAAAAAKPAATASGTTPAATAPTKPQASPQ